MICDICGNVMEDGTQVCPVCGRQFFEKTSVEPQDVKTEDIDSAFSSSSNEEKNEEHVEPTENVEAAKDAEATDNSTGDEGEGTAVLTSDIDSDEDEEKTVVIDPNEKIFGGMPNGMPPAGGPNGRPPMGAPNGMGMPPMGGPNGMGMPPMGGPNGMPQSNGANGQPPKAKQKKKMSTGKKVALITIPLVILAAAGTVAAIFVPKFLNYNKAQEKLADGDIDKAVELFEDLGNFKDAEEMANGGAYFEYATALMEDKNYSLAAEYFGKAMMHDYEGASDKMHECYYYYAEELLAQGKYDEAMEAFELARPYGDADSKVKEVYYEEGVDHMNAGDYESAITCFTDAEGYQNADDLIKQCYYQMAEELEASGDYEEAYDYFLLSEYDDYETRANDCMYSYAKASYDNGDYEEAIEVYEQIDPDYKDCSKDIDNCYIGLAKKSENAEDYKSAIEYYEKVTGSDVAASIRKDKASYIEAHFTNTDALTMEYVCDLKYEVYGTAVEDYLKLSEGWAVASFVNHDENDYENTDNTIDTKSTVYVHTVFINDEGEPMNLKAYIVYSNGTKSNEISYESVESNYGTWVSIDPGVQTGDTSLYIYNTDTNVLLEKYTFTLTD